MFSSTQCCNLKHEKTACEKCYTEYFLTVTVYTVIGPCFYIFFSEPGV